MTIIANVKVRDGTVLATDSMSQLTIRDESGRVGIVKTYCNARKLFQIRELPIGIMSFGLGNIGPRSIESLVLEFSRKLNDLVEEPWTVEAILRGFYRFIQSLYNEAFQGTPVDQRRQHLRLGFFISGYSPDRFLAEEWEFELPDDTDIRQVRAEGNFGSSWRGIPIPFGRLYNGFDLRIAQALKDAGVTDEIIGEVLKVEKWRMPVAYDGMPVQDAINFAVYILETTIGAATFERTPAPSCGGPLQVAVILPDKGWQWVREPKYSIE